ncbi:MAG: hypothetical protein ACKO2P_09535, partial [Planctomycetota bacterium]
QCTFRVEINNRRVRAVEQEPGYLDFLLGRRGEPPCVFQNDGDRVLGKWAVSELRAYTSQQQAHSATAETELPYWMEHGAVHLLADFQAQFKALHDFSGPGERIVAAHPLISAIDLLATLQKHAADQNLTVVHSVVRKTLPLLAACLKECEPPFSDASRTAGRGTFLSQERSEAIGRKKILDLFSESYATDHLALVLRWIVRTDFLQWPEVVDSMLARDDYVVRFAVAEGQAERFTIEMVREVETNVHPSPRFAISELRELLEHTDINRQELGCYAVASVAASFLVDGNLRDLLTPDDTIEIWKLVHLVAALKYYFARSALGDMLICLAIHGSGGTGIIHALSKDGKLDAFWNCHWEHTQLDIEFLKAAGFHPHHPVSDVNSLTHPAWYLQQAERARRALEGLRRDDSDLYDVLLKKFRVTGFPSTSAEDSSGEYERRFRVKMRQWIFSNINSGDKVLNLVEVMFLHPLWSEIERFASELTGFATHDTVWKTLITNLLRRMMIDREKQDWRIDNAVNESAYLMGSWHDTQAGPNAAGAQQRLFDDVVMKSCGHAVSRVRANLCENFVADLKNVWGLQTTSGAVKGMWLDRLCSGNWDRVIEAWMQDSDAWVLEHVYRLFRILHRIKSNLSIADNSRLEKWLIARSTTLMTGGNEGCLLAKVQFRAATAEKTWAELERRDFLDYLEDAKAAMP